MENVSDDLKKIWDASSDFSSEIRSNPDVSVIAGSRVIDYSGIPEYAQVNGLIEAELSDRAPGDETDPGSGKEFTEIKIKKERSEAES